MIFLETHLSNGQQRTKILDGEAWPRFAEFSYRVRVREDIVKDVIEMFNAQLRTEFYGTPVTWGEFFLRIPSSMNNIDFRIDEDSD